MARTAQISNEKRQSRNCPIQSRNCSPNKCITDRVTDTSQHKLFRGDFMNQAFTVKLLQRDTNKKMNTNKMKRLAWAKKHEQWTLDRWKSVLWSGFQIWDFWFQPPCLCETRCGWTNDLCMCGSHCEAWRRWCDGVEVLCWWHCQNLFRIQGTPSMATIAFCSDAPSHLVCN